MTATIEIPSALQKFVDNKLKIEVPGDNVREAINNLIKAHGGLKEHLFDEQGRIRSFVNIYLNDEDVRFLNQLDTALKEGDVLSILPALAGGAP